ncbi:MAG: lamin tail domain-containing protein, partial [Phycisphaerae bacterium]|nr:lamin tail domain-containing protein [Phycisphaerae bacterium]
MSKFVKTALISLPLLVFFAGPGNVYPAIIGDLDGNYRIDYRDVRILAEEWLDPICLISGCKAELDNVNGVAMGDLAVLANNWKREEAFVVISEFMASNINTLLDGDNKSSDWIEIYNPTDTTISLAGWYLTDNDANLTKWQFPSGVVIKPGKFLIVFASDKKYEDYPYNYPYLDPAGYYHTNFELDQAGEYLALVAPDGTTIVHEYKPKFPVQLTDVSYGLAQHATTLVPTGATASYHVPVSGDAALGTTWTEVAFNDSGWDTGKTGIGFGNVVPGLNVTYYKANTTVDSLTAAEAVLSDPSSQTEVVTETASLINYFNTGNEGHYVNNNPFPGTTIGTDIEDFVVLVTGMVLIPDADEWTFGVNSDDGFGLQLTNGIDVFNSSYPDPRGPGDTLATFNITQAGLYDLRLVFFERGGGSELELFAARGNFAAFDTPSFDLVGDTANGGLEASSFSNEVGTDVQGLMQNLNASMWTRIEFEVEDPQFYDMLMLQMKYEDGFVAYLNGQKVSEANAPSPVLWDSTADSDRPSEESLVFTNFNIMAHLGLLLPKPQKNVLAIHGLNDNKNDGEFLILPELVIAKNQMVPQYFTTPTPEGFNISGTTDIVEEVWFSHSRGFYNALFPLTLSTATNGAEIRYTTDGSRPTATHGNIYSSPLPISHTTTLRAVAVKPGFLDSDVKTHTYIFISDVITQSPNGETPGPGWPAQGYFNGQLIDYGMDPDVVNDPRYSGVIDDALLAIPSFSLVTDLANMFDPGIGIWVNAGQEGIAWERPVSVELINPNGTDGFQIDAGMRIRGGYSVDGSNPKHAFRLFFRSIYGAPYGEGKLRYPLFGDEGVSEFDHMDLRCSQNYSWAFSGDDKNTMVREVFSRDVQGMTGHPYTRSRYYHLYVNGHYWGLFQTQERSEASFAETYFGGDKLDYDVISSNWSAGRQMVPTDGDRQSLDRLYYETIAGFDNYERYYRVQALNIDGTPYLGSDPNYEMLLDVDNLIDFMIIEYYTGDSDGPGSRFGGIPNNTWCIYNRVNPLGWMWFHHDNEHTLGAGGATGSIENLVSPFTTAGAQIQYFNPQWLHEQLANTNVDYRLHFADHVYRHFFNDGLLTVGQARKNIQTRANQINMAIIAESARWGDSKVATPRTKDDTWLPEINRLLYSSSDPWGRKTYVTPRVPVVLGQFLDVGWYPYVQVPVFNQHGGPVVSGFNLTMDPNGSGTIYYTLDGSDPRLSVALSSSGSPVTLVAENAAKRVFVPTGSLDGTAGSILYEYWDGIAGTAVSDLTSSPDYPGNPTSINYMTSFEAPSDWDEQYGIRMRGYLHPPANDNYTFWISSDDASELWLSTDDDPINKVLIAYENSWTQVRVWELGGAEESAPIPLVGGQKYYIEALMKENDGGDNLAVAWSLDNNPPGYLDPPIDGQYLSPIGDTWATSYYDDSNWPSGTGGVGYERNPGDPINYTGLFNINVEGDMYGNNGTCYIRIPFNVSSTDLAGLTLRMRYDDGFIAYINGVEVKRRNFTETPQWNSDANEMNADENAVSFENFDISGYISVLNPGDNILAIQGLNYGITSSDFLISVELVASQVGQGDVAPGAIQYTAPVTLNKSTQVKARNFDAGAWSALHEAVFAIGPLAENLRITEIMFNPRNTGNPNDPNTEFIELKNTGLTTLNLNLVKFTEGIHFTFPDMELDPDQCVVVVRNQSAFEAKYGTSVNMAGEYTGSLDNNGERIRLEDAIGRTVLDFKYKDDWFEITDGDGFSLTIIEPSDTAVYGLEGLFAHWKFDDGSGNTAEDSAGSNNGALIGNPTWTTGRVEGALSFDGSGEYVVAAPVAPLATDTFSVQAWIRIDEAAAAYNPFLMQNTYTGSYGFYFYISNDKPDVYIFGSSGYANARSNNTLNADQWYHVAATNDGSNLKLYVDGQLKDSDSSTGLTGVNQNVYIGCEPISSIYYKGL